MIETVEIKNYQPHKHTVLNFSKGVNVIKGSSHGGKSSIWRAINWLLQNRPLGEGFHSHFTKEDTEVHIEFDNAVVSRIKGKNKNQYEVSGHPDPLEALRSDLPKEVTDKTQMGAINLSGQDDPYFLILDPPGKVAKMLNDVVGLDIIDKSLKNCNSIISKSKSHKEILQKDIENNEKKLETLKWVDSAELLINKLKNKVQRREGLQDKITKILDLRATLVDTMSDIDLAKQWLLIVPHVEQLQKKILSYHKLRSELCKMDSFRAELDLLIERITDTKIWLEIKEPVQAIESKLVNYEHLKDDLWRLESLYDSIKKLEIDVNSANTHVRILRKQYDEKLKSAGVCPLCKRPW